MDDTKQQSNTPIEEFQCKIHELSKNKDWINIKRSFIRAPQIFKQKLNIGSQLEKDEEFENLYEVFQKIDNNLLILQVEVTKNYDMVKDFLKYLINFVDSLSKVFHNETNDDFEIVSKGYSELCVKLTEKLKEIEIKVLENINMIIKLIKDPLLKIQQINKNIKLYIKEREFAILDINKYSNNINILKDKIERHDKLSLKQEENLIRYQKNLEFGELKYEKFNNCLKAELPKFFKLINDFIKPIMITIFFLQLTNFYYFMNINEISDPLFKLRSKEIEIDNKSFFDDLVQKYNKNHQKAKDSLETLMIIKPKQELFMVDDLNTELNNINLHTQTNNDVESEAQESIRTAYQICIAEFDFEAQEPGDLTFKKGDKIKVLDNKLSGDWWKGELNNNIGIFPKNYVSF